MKTKLKTIYYKLNKAKQRILSGKPVLVVLYHRISNEVRNELKYLTVDLVSFEQQLCYFKKNYQILRLSDDWSALKKTGIVITFDDGYADNLLNALPLLEKYQIPATIFVTTLNIDSKKEFWWDRFVFDYMYCEPFFYLPDTKEKVSKKMHSYADISNFISKLATEKKERWFLEFEKLNKIPFFDNEHFRSLSNEELKYISNHPLIDIGIHTHNHYPFKNLSYQEQKEELRYSIEKLNKLITKPISYLALPHGSYNDQTLKVVEELNCLGMLLANNNYSNYRNKLSKKINRILITNIKGKELVKHMNRFDFKIW
ncbi:polysaccharide deacetylase family protein [Flavobacterium sp. C3NV]|uniref:polysaccharide deacetylase family protein n=1 Tax=Flavobacterium sp. C3NV TaxID=3393358 RepID=UPI00398FF879